MGTGEGFAFDEEKFSERLGKAMEESDEVLKVLKAASNGSESQIIERLIAEGITEYGLLFKGFKRIKDEAVDQALQIRENLKTVPMQRIEAIRSIDPPEDPVLRAAAFILMSFVETNFKMTGTVVSFLIEGPLVLMEGQLQAVEKANGMVLGLGQRKFSVQGYSAAMAIDAAGVFAPIISQIDYLRRTLFQREKAKLAEIEQQASTLGKAIKFCEYVKLANLTSHEFERVTQSAAELLVNFLENQLPASLYELGV